MNKFWSETVQRTEPYVPGEQLDDPTIIKLNTNENPYPPSPKVTDAISRELDHKLNLYPSPTTDQLRNEIATYHNLSKDHVFVGNGSDEVLAFSFMAFFEPGKPIRFPAISYSFYPVYAKLFNIPYEEIILNRDFTLPVEDFFQSEGGVIFPNPNAPTSVYLELSGVIDILENNPNQIVIIDEAYIDFATESAASLIHTYENLLIVQTMSKSRSLAGLRVGFAMGNPNLIEALIRIKDSFNSYTLDRLAIAGAEAAIKDTDYFTDTIEKVIHTREWVTAEMKQRGFHVLPSQTNFIFACHYNWIAEDLYTNLKKDGILVRHFKKPSIDNYLRVTIGTDENMEDFFKKLDKIMNTTKSRN
ncbi:histidinol-phosphate aminotransferase [Virgibacillus natechei]|uniref:Histidinol-phosphate aminotransferase n=1 Tax=Virgibacillus natechei TaxID=1216297 RepID=A0ABS4IC71_9BACI|nr:histidinol-phosphate transaminase [Virgibacillus natechei]MBP1968534.1 histidinol-phosphate aminotransferase [Virgibacillus natechei]UZD13649.1 histidinol-phosphate transaminase [Virgibacillus natechei]